MQVQEESLMVSKDETQMMIMIKGKRTKRQRAPSPLRLAMPISTSSSTNNNSIDSATTTTTIESSRGEEEEQEEEYMANCLILLAQGRHIHHVAAPTPHNNNNNNKSTTTPSTSLYLYQCKTCNRCFSSFQALGGHRASHKMPKQNGAFSSEPVTNNTFIEDINNNDHHHHRYSYDNPTTSTTLSLKIPNGVTNLCSTSTTKTTKVAKVHECSICGAEFSSGQALGGHMRRHRTLVNVSATTTTTTSMSGSHHELQQPKKHLKLDLNLPAPQEDDHRSEESKFSFQKRENVIVFSKPSLVDCHY